ncbi:MAG: HDOD domain-containing protein [Phycisphaerae bacterium]|nr:HDOD domain-containing protein [Phycisphaerae bacterium]NUQ46723.1 HDOD domain-containing protein [Phycisphaerae bacterium]
MREPGSSAAATSVVDAQQVERVLAQLSSLPTLAPVAVRLLTLTARVDADLGEVVRLIESDAPLAARVLSEVQKAHRGIEARSVTLHRAVALLGLNPIRQIVLMSKVLEVFGAHDARSEALFDRRAYWKHCLAAACVAQGLAAHASPPCDPDAAFLGGLLHDLGKAAFDACIPKSYERVLSEAERRRCDLLLIEREILGTDHTVAGRRVAERWRLPGELIECIWLHHLPPDALPSGLRAPELVKLVWLSDLLVRSHHIGSSGNSAAGPPLEEAATMAGVPAGACRAVLATLPQAIEDRASWVGLEDVASGQLYLEALAQSTGELARLNEDIRARNERLTRTADYFRAVHALNHDLPFGATPGEACRTAAAALGSALGIEPVLVYVREPGRAGAIVSSSLDAEELVLSNPPGWSDGAVAQEERAAETMAAGGLWIAPVSPALRPLCDAHRALLGDRPVWLLPIVRGREWVAGALFAADAMQVAHWRHETSELQALSAAAAFAISHARTRLESARLQEGLAWAQQRLAAAQSELVAARGLRMTAEMAAGAAHELNTPLAIISGRAQLLRERTTDATIRQSLEEIVAASQRAGEIISDLMEFAEPGEVRPESIATAAFLPPLIEEWRGIEPQAVRIELDQAVSLADAVCDASHLRGALHALLRNAIEALPEAGGRVLVKAWTDLTDDSVVIEVSDNGRGMTPEVRARAFDPFFSHRPAGRGRGMGLPRALRWIRANGGTLSLDSTPGGGTTARIRLPAAKTTV